MQGILQGFRVVGSGSKLGREYPVTAYRLGGRVTLEKLLEFIPDSNGEQQRLELTDKELIKVEQGISPFKVEIAKFINDSSHLVDGYQNEIQALRNISFRNIAGVITTNYDSFFERLFSDYQTYVGQDELIFSPIQGFAEIYKIHGSVTRPETIIINEEDYREFKEKSKYLTAKLLTIFMEYPIILDRKSVV